MSVYSIYFSPTGGTKNVADILTKEFSNCIDIDLCTPVQNTKTIFSENDLCCIAVPSFGGRVPATAAGRLKTLTGNHTSAVLIVVYGNRAYEDTLLELSKHPNINGLKAASGNFSLLAEAMAKCGDNLNVWSGNDDQIVPLMSLGGKGVISVLSNVAPQVAHDITQLCFDNRYPEAAKLQLQYHDLIDALFCEVNPIPVKKAMELLGWKVGGLRLPLVEPSEEHIAYIKRELENAGCKI